VTDYELVITDVADGEIDAIADWLALNVSAEYAGRWYEGLRDALRTLTFMPRSHAIAPENPRYEYEVRRLLYYGPSKRRGHSVYRVLFHVIEPGTGDEPGIVRVLHVRHGARQAEGIDEAPESD
jgi:plasmid stabilization system protein ParE